ncbi:Protein of unknown function [Gryllus bimaculatus]|nr:Protein of unknown function [Gryllus bimaculatus]
MERSGDLGGHGRTSTCSRPGLANSMPCLMPTSWDFQMLGAPYDDPPLRGVVFLDRLEPARRLFSDLSCCCDCIPSLKGMLVKMADFKVFHFLSFVIIRREKRQEGAEKDVSCANSCPQKGFKLIHKHRIRLLLSKQFTCANNSNSDDDKTTLMTFIPNILNRDPRKYPCLITPQNNTFDPEVNRCLLNLEKVFLKRATTLFCLGAAHPPKLPPRPPKFLRATTQRCRRGLPTSFYRPHQRDGHPPSSRLLSGRPAGVRPQIDEHFIVLHKSPQLNKIVVCRCSTLHKPTARGREKPIYIPLDI